MTHFLKFLPIVAVCVVCGLSIWTGSEALAAAPSCSDARGSTLAMHSRTLCQSLARRARREHPRWTYHVHSECRSETRVRSSCTWTLAWRGHGVSCRGKATVTGAAHPRVRYGEQSCVA